MLSDLYEEHISSHQSFLETLTVKIINNAYFFQFAYNFFSVVINVLDTRATSFIFLSLNLYKMTAPILLSAAFEATIISSLRSKHVRVKSNIEIFVMSSKKN